MTVAVVLASGGLDSTTVAFQVRELGYDVQPLFLDYSQHCVEKEWDTVRRVFAETPIEHPARVSIGDVFRQSNSRLIREADLWREPIKSSDLYIPYRTLLFFSVAAAFAQTIGSTEVYSGFINSNVAQELDCTADFFNKLEMFTDQIGSVKFRMPFRASTKADVVREALRLGVPIGATFSCQVYSDTPCGACPNCVERLAAVREVRSHVQS